MYIVVRLYTLFPKGLLGAGIFCFPKRFLLFCHTVRQG